jgi:hypothetical protein
MNTHREEQGGNKALMDTLLALDGRMPVSSAEGREVAQKVLRRDRRRIRVLTGLTIAFFLLTVLGIGSAIYWYVVKVVPVMNFYEQNVFRLDPQISKLEPDLSKRKPQTDLAMSTAIACRILYKIQLANLGGTMALFVVVLAAALCTVLLIRASRGATLRQIQASLLVLSEQLDAMQPPLPGARLSGGGQTSKESGG